MDFKKVFKAYTRAIHLNTLDLQQDIEYTGPKYFRARTNAFSHWIQSKINPLYSSKDTKHLSYTHMLPISA